MHKFYQREEIPKRLALLAQGCVKPEEEKAKASKSIWCGDEKGSLIIGLVWVTLFNFNGIGSLIFYSGSLFDDESRSSSLAIVYTIFALSTLIGIFFLNFVGRKPLMIVLQIIAMCAMFSLWFFTEVEKNQTACLIAMMSFLIAIASGMGQILFVYLGEICSD